MDEFLLGISLIVILSIVARLIAVYIRVPAIVPLLIVVKLEQYDHMGATAIAAVIIGASFLLLLVINLLQRWRRNRLFGE